MIFLYYADKQGAITNPIETESKFIYFVTQEAVRKLSRDEVNILIECFDEHSLDLKTELNDLLSNEFKDGSFLCIFYNDVAVDKDWYKWSFWKRSKDDYYSFKIKTGLFEKLILYEYDSGEEIILFEHYIPMLQNKYNVLQINIIDNHIIILLNRNIIFHLHLEECINNGKMVFESRTRNIQSLKQVRYTAMTEQRKIKMKKVIDQLPFTAINKKEKNPF